MGKKAFAKQQATSLMRIHLVQSRHINPYMFCWSERFPRFQSSAGVWMS
jgi:hypothetical protein